jgi:hypothetical protein
MIIVHFIGVGELVQGPLFFIFRDRPAPGLVQRSSKPAPGQVPGHQPPADMLSSHWSPQIVWHALTLHVKHEFYVQPLSFKCPQRYMHIQMWVSGKCSLYSDWDIGWMCEEALNFQQGQVMYLFSKESRPGAGAHPSSCSVGTSCTLLQGVKWLWCC